MRWYNWLAWVVVRPVELAVVGVLWVAGALVSVALILHEFRKGASMKEVWDLWRPL